MPGVHCISIKLSTSILNLERMMTGRSRTGSLKHLVLFPMFLVVLQRKLQKKMDQVLAPREFRSAYAEKHRQGEPSFTNYAWVKDESNRRILRVHFYWEVSVCFFFFFLGGGGGRMREYYVLCVAAVFWSSLPLSFFLEFWSWKQLFF